MRFLFLKFLKKIKPTILFPYECDLHVLPSLSRTTHTCNQTRARDFIMEGGIDKKCVQHKVTSIIGEYCTFIGILNFVRRYIKSVFLSAQQNMNHRFNQLTRRMEEKKFVPADKRPIRRQRN